MTAIPSRKFLQRSMIYNKWERMPILVASATPATQSVNCLVRRSSVYTGRTWAEDRATRERDPSANPGAKTGVGGTTPPLGIPGLAAKR